MMDALCSVLRHFRFLSPAASSADAASRRWTAALVLVLFSGVLFFYGLTAGDLWRTESLRALIAQEMLTGGDWVVRRLYGEPIFTKPPGMYLAIVLCSLPFG